MESILNISVRQDQNELILFLIFAQMCTLLLSSLIFTIIFQNPSASFYLLPLPIQIPAWGIAAVLLGMDFLSFNVAGFGGVTASYLMINYFL